MTVRQPDHAGDIDWNFGDRDDAIHRIHAYPAKFPGFITTKALEYAERRGVDVNVVADVFCGCGTTAVEAKRKGKDFWGCDLNPVATLIARVKTRRYRDHRLVQYFAAVCDDFHRTKPSERDHWFIDDRIRYWFDEPTIEDLLRLDTSIRRRIPAGSQYRTFFLCAFSNILKCASHWLTASIKPQLDPAKQARAVLDAFEDQFALMRRANETNHFPEPEPRVEIRTRNFLAPPAPTRRADLIVTSPPYVTSYDYAALHQLSTMWLRHTPDYRNLRTHMLGAEYGVPGIEAAAIQRLGQRAADTCQRLRRHSRRKADSVARYFLDIEKTVIRCRAMLNDGGIAVFVIGNTEYKTIRIDNAQHLADCMKRAGFRGIETAERKVSSKTMTPYRDAHGRFTRDASGRRVYDAEFVVIGKTR